MNPDEPDGGERIRRLAGAALGACRILLDDHARKASDLDRTRRDARLRIRTLVRTKEEIEARIALVERFVPIGAASSLINRNAASRSRELGRSLLEAKALLSSSNRTARRIETAASRFRDLSSRLARAREHRFRGVPSLEIEDALEALERRTELLSRNRPSPARHADLCADILRTASRLARAPAAEAAPISAARPRTVPAPRSSVAEDLKDLKIHLPIPRTLWNVAGRRGALRDAEAPKGTSPFYVLPSMDLRPFADLLPSALRGPQSFAFPPIHPSAPGQNLWTMFDADTWSHIRNTSYGLSGHRCSICGGRGGYVADKLYPDGSRSGVDCHEIWEWTAPDLAEGVGIQTLRNLLVVCVSCHSAFHENYFVRLAEGVGEADRIRAHIGKRRHLMTRLDAATLGSQLAAEKEQLERLNGITDWIVDLDYLSRQQFMLDRNPVFVERNPAGMPASRIAGLGFETDRGEFHVRRTADKVYAEIAAEKRKPDSLRKRSLPTTSAGSFGR